MLPAAIDFFGQSREAVELQKKRTRCIVLAVRTSFYTMLVTWSFFSIYTGKFVVRMAINVIFFFITAIFMGSLLRIKKLIAVID